MRHCLFIIQAASWFWLLATQVRADVPAWHMDYLVQLVNERLDSVVSPGAVSSHMHRVVGGSNFGANYNYANLTASTCTTAGISADKSNYWMPQLYWINNDTSGSDGAHTFTQIPAAQRFYYFLAPQLTYTQRVAPFPKGLRMVIGDVNSKKSDWYVTWFCQGATATTTGPDFNFNTECSAGMKTEIHFPPCWDGVNLYKTDGTHMAYSGGGASTDNSCPFSHPIKLPQIMLEYTWLTSSVAPGVAIAGNLAWANGDTTGGAIHADFQNGWDIDVLQKAINSDQCAGNLGAMPFEDCEVFYPYWNKAAAGACKPALGAVPEATGQGDKVILAALPGCNKLWASGDKPTCSSFSTPDITKWLGTQEATSVAGAKLNALNDTAGVWQDIGCWSGTQTYTAYYADAKTMTHESCTSYCAESGYNFTYISGIYCRCGTTFDQRNSYAANCTSACVGNTTQTCGQSGAQIPQVFYNSAPSTANTTSYVGCYSDYTSYKDYTFQSTSMTPSQCAQGCAEMSPNSTYAGLYNGGTCYCGSAVPSGKLLSTWCTTTCVGDASQQCGTNTRLSVYSITSSDRARATASLVNNSTGLYIGCIAAQNNGQLMNTGGGNSVTLTPADCQRTCGSRNFTMAGVWGTKYCQCGSAFQNGGGKLLPTLMCNTTCPGNSSLTCGGSQSMMSVYQTSYALSKSLLAGKSNMGCWHEPASGNRTFTDVTFTWAGNTVEACIAACQSKNARYAGMENGSRCQCGSAGSWGKGEYSVLDSECSMNCTGNTSEKCGYYSNDFNAYDLSLMTLAPVPSYAAGYQGCYTAGRNGYYLLNGKTLSLVSNSNTVCTAQCKYAGFAMAATQGTACYCGNTLVNQWDVASVLSPDSLCTTTCPSASTSFCGGTYNSANYASVFFTNGSSSYASADAASTNTTTTTTSSIATSAATSTKANATSTTIATSASTTKVSVTASVTSTSAGTASVTSATTAKSATTATATSSSAATASATSTSKSTSATVSATASTSAKTTTASATTFANAIVTSGSTCGTVTVTVTVQGASTTSSTAKATTTSAFAKKRSRKAANKHLVKIRNLIGH